MFFFQLILLLSTEGLDIHKVEMESYMDVFIYNYIIISYRVYKYINALFATLSIK